MNIKKEHLETLWYENEKGKKFIPDLEGGYPEIPKGFIYQCSQFPDHLNYNILRSVVKAEVDACDHPDENIVKTYGWIEGIEGRECKKCRGTQVKEINEFWHNEWDAEGSRSFMSGGSSWSEDLVLAIEKNSEYSLSEAILIAANACERCMNTLADQYGLAWGYKYRSKDWYQSGTECEFCKSYSFNELPMPEGRRVM